METIAMMEFTLAIDLGKKERIDPDEDGGMPVDRAFVAQALVDLAANVQAGGKQGAILDETGLEVGGWRFSLLPFAGS
jgi:hypothetical protein